MDIASEEAEEGAFSSVRLAAAAMAAPGRGSREEEEEGAAPAVVGALEGDEGIRTSVTVLFQFLSGRRSEI